MPNQQNSTQKYQNSSLQKDKDITAEIDTEFLNNLLTGQDHKLENLYGEDQREEVQYIVSPLKDSNYEPRFTNSPEQKCGFDEVKSNTCDFKDAMRNDRQISARQSEGIGLTERISYNPKIHLRKSHLEVPSNMPLKSRNKKNEFDFYTHRETNKSDSSYIPTFSKIDYDEEVDQGNFHSF